MDLFWSKVMPASIVNYPWAKEFSASTSEKKWESGLKTKIKAMDDAEFDLFLASVVMSASKELLMGKGLTDKINLFRELRK